MIWSAGSSSTSESDVTIYLGLVEFSCEGWGVKVASEDKATLMGCTTNVGSSDKEGLSSKLDCSIKNDLMLAMFLNAMPKEMLECVALRCYGLYSGWMMSS